MPGHVRLTRAIPEELKKLLDDADEDLEVGRRVGGGREQRSREQYVVLQAARSGHAIPAMVLFYGPFGWTEPRCHGWFCYRRRRLRTWSMAISIKPLL